MTLPPSFRLSVSRRKNNDGHSHLQVLLGACAAFVLIAGAVLPSLWFSLQVANAATITFVQSNFSCPQSPQSTVNVTYNSVQVAGDLNVVVVGWNDSTAAVTAVTDTKANVYTLAAGPTQVSGALSQAIYIAKNIAGAAANGNTVTVKFSVAAAYPDIRVLEYSGLDTVSPVDVVAAATGNSASSNSGSATTVNTTDLIFGANIVQTSTNAAGTGFTQRVITSPDGDIAEDKLATTAGIYNATAPLTGSGPWIMQMVALRAAGSGPPPPNTTPPTVSITAPAAGAIVAGTITVSANASGNVALAGVQFQVDGANVGSEVTTPPYSISLSTVTLTNAAHTLTAIARDTSNNKTTSSPVGITVDNLAPSVSITAPAAGATVSGAITVSANASDNVAVAGVQFQADGANIGAEVASSPYSVSFDTTTVADGAHSLTAVARDQAGNRTTSTAVNIMVSNSGDPSLVGRWTAPFSWPEVAIHMALLPTGKVLNWDDHTDNPPGQVWNPATGTFKAVPYFGEDLFCAGHTMLPDGRVIVVGGHIDAYVGIPSTTIFDPTTEAWSGGANMAFARWYPTATSLPDGRILVLSGATNCPTCNTAGVAHPGIVDTPEIYDPASNTWTQLSAAKLSLPLYPHVFVMPDGRLLITSTQEDPIPTYILDLRAQTWTVVDSRILDGSSTAMYRPNKFMKSGTARNPDYSVVSAAATTYVLDMDSPTPAWRQTAAMNFPRTQQTLVMLPDGNVLAVGGGTNSDVNDLSAAVHRAEMWSPTGETWTTMAANQVPRLYHSTALLLPDGRVLVAGSGHPVGFGVPQFSAEIYSPPYLFKGLRPTIGASPTLIQYGQTFFVGTPDASRIASVALIRTGSVTHAFDENQRYLPLSFQVASGGLNVQAPQNTYLAPPGYYMLFILDTNGIPSVASFVKFPNVGPDTQPPTVPTGLSATTSTGRVSLSWTASTDNFGVTGYNIHRATAPGVVPSAGNRIGQSSTTSYTDVSFTTGTYYYVVTAQDAAGNISGPSNEVRVVAAGDTTPPTVSITSPTTGSTVSLNVTISASASDDVIVAGVQFLLDGAPLGTELTAPPYSLVWDSTTVPNGSHTISAKARDGAGNTATATGVTIFTSNVGPPGLIAAYSFSEGAGTTVADVSGHGNTGTISGATWTTLGRFGNALAFNGTSSMVTINESSWLDLTSGLTLEAWVYPTAPALDYRDIIYKEVDRYYLEAGSERSTPVFGGTFTSGNTNIYAPATLPTNTWTHLAATFDGSTMTLYVNGVQVASQAQTTPLTTSTGALHIGGDPIFGQFFNGRIDEVRVYNRALTQTRIQTDMNAPLP